MNANWWRYDLETKPCGITSRGSWIVDEYDQPGVRDIVRSQLAAMRASGFDSLRIMVFHRHADPGKFPFGSPDGSISPSAAARLGNFVQDIAAAGFVKLEVAPAFVLENALWCRKQQAGDCFDPSRTDENYRFIAGVARITIASSGTMPLVFDLGNEYAPDPRMPQSAREHAKAYLQTIAGRFIKDFDRSWVISAARPGPKAPPATLTARVELLLADLSEAGITPKLLEIHDYANDAADFEEVLDQTETLAQRIGARFTVGEMLYHSDAQANGAVSWLKANPSSRLDGFIEWPTKLENPGCEIAPDLPFTPGPLLKIHVQKNGP